jgi:hypothetical protein
VHLFGSVAFVALKIFFFMDIRWNPCIFSKILFFYPAAMTGGTDLKHRRSSLIEMGIEKPPSDGFRSADMALTATAVTAITMRCSGLSEFVQYSRFGSEAFFGHFFESSEADVKAARVMLGDILMALPAGRRSVRIRGIFDHSLMGSFPVWIIGVAAVALFAAELTVIFVFCDFTVYVYFFMRSQRLHISTSALTFCF